MSEESNAARVVIGKTVASVEATTSTHWDESVVEDGVALIFTDGTRANFYGMSIQDHGYVGVSVQGGDAL